MIPHLPILGLQIHVTIPGLYVGAGDPNASTHTYTASTLTLNHLPNPQDPLLAVCPGALTVRLRPELVEGGRS